MRGFSVSSAVALALAFALCSAHPQQAGQLTIEQRFEQLDRNGDGRLTPQELPNANLLRQLDQDGDGALTLDEVQARAGRRQPGQAPTAPADPDREPRPHGQQAVDAGLSPEVLGRLDTAMQQTVLGKEVAGLIGLIHHDGVRGYSEAFGMQDIEAGKAMPLDAIFRLQSMTKPIVAVTALTLYDEGKFALDDPIAPHCPEWAEPQVLEDGQLVPARNAITPRMLMSHSSGLYYGTIEGGAFAGGAVRRTPGMTLETYSQALADRPLKFQPGEGYQYGTSIDVLGRYIEALTGQPLDEVVRQRVTGPLKMVDTDFWVPLEKAGRVAQLYRQPAPGELVRGRPIEQLLTRPTLFLGGQGLCSTVIDYERFCLMILNRGELDGVRVLKPETVDLIFQNHVRAPGRMYGLGGAVDGEGGYAWGGANGTQFWIDRTHSLFGIFMVQTQRYRAPTCNTFRALANEAAGIVLQRRWDIPEEVTNDE
jgi:CubicO group peptidase (beta-lactamase class C family)